MILALSESLKILSHHGIETVGDELLVSSISWVLLPVKEPLWDVVLSWSGDDVVDSLDFLLSHLSGSLFKVDLSDLKGKNCESSSETSDLSKTEWSLLFTVDVCVLHSKNMSEFVWVL